MSANDDTRIKREREEEKKRDEPLNDESRAKMRKMIINLAIDQPVLFDEVMGISKKINAVMNSIGEDGLWYSNDPHPYEMVVNEDKLHTIVMKKLTSDPNKDIVAIQKTIDAAIDDFYFPRIMQMRDSEELYEFITRKVNEM